MEAVIERVWRCTWRQESSEIGGTLGGRDRANLVIHFGGRDRARLDEYLEPVDGRRAGC